MYLPVTCSGRFICLWHLKPSTSKTVTSVFHLHNNRSHRELNVHMNGQCLKHKPYSVCLGVTLDRTLSCRGHLSHSAVKLKSWNNLIATLHTSALAICYSIAEYCCLVWARSSYTNLIVSQLHSSMRLISGCLQPTQHSWLPLVSNIVPPSLYRKTATDSMLQIIEAHPNGLVHAGIFEHPPLQLASRHPVWSDMTSVDTVTQWREDWSSASVVNHTIVTDPTIWQPDVDLPHHTWSLLNHFRTSQDPCHANLHK